MLYPREMAVFGDPARAAEFLRTRPDLELPVLEDRNIAGQVAGGVLLALYLMAMSPWKESAPSLSRAIAATEKMALRSRDPRLPRGHTKIEECFNAMRPVAHLWAADRLRVECRLNDEDRDLLDGSGEGLRMLLGLARTLQDFALEWKPARTRETPSPLLGSSPWLVPEGVAPLCPQWTEASRPQWLVEASAKYKRRSRG
jgi:hypothetical protein